MDLLIAYIRRCVLNTPSSMIDKKKIETERKTYNCYLFYSHMDHHYIIEVFDNTWVDEETQLDDLISVDRYPSNASEEAASVFECMERYLMEQAPEVTDEDMDTEDMDWLED
jgi:hypothetical protein